MEYLVLREILLFGALVAPLLALLPDAVAETTDHWAYQPVGVAEPPGSDDGGSAIDRFILQRLRSEGLQPAPQADAAVRLRRVHFVLTGLPPTAEQLEAFLADPTDDAYRAVVDRLLASREFGERWGRHWLDVARFAESSGGGRSLMFPEAWRYRDYVIDALNDDVPFDRFIVEQLAGDHLPADSPAERDRLQVATGFLVLGAINYELQDKALLEMEIVDEQIETVGRAFLGLSIGCARCHDHKFDPISQRDYYGLAGIFTSTASVKHENVSAPHSASLATGDDVDAYAAHVAEIDSLKSQMKQLEADLRSVEHDAELTETDRQTADDELHQSKARLQEQIKSKQKNSPRQPRAMSVADAKQVGDTNLRVGGVADLQGERVPRGFVPIAGRASQGLPSDKSGRLELARWIASPDNHLTSRVIVNRVWHHAMGNGLVPTTDDFGIAGERPTHPELLDHLAASFVDDGWSLKRLIRRIVLSETFQRSSQADELAAARDPDNRYLARAPVRQLDAEAVRDALLTISGRLDDTAGGPSIRKITAYDYGYKFDSRRRSVYVPRFRSEQLDAFEVFDGANPNCVTGCRNQTQLATQALFMLNSPLVIESAQSTAEMLLGVDATDNERIVRLYHMALGRSPTAGELTAMRDYLSAARAADAASEQQAYSGLCQLVFCSLDFRYLQ